MFALIIQGFSFRVNRAGDVEILNRLVRDALHTLWEPSVCRSQDTAAAPSNATARWPWECRAVASFWQHDKSLNQRTGPTPPRIKKCAEGSRLGRGWRLIECQKWWCENAQCHRVCFVMCLFSGGRRQGKRGSWWNDYIEAERGRGASCWTAGRNHHCLTQFYNAQ